MDFSVLFCPLLAFSLFSLLTVLFSLVLPQPPLFFLSLLYHLSNSLFLSSFHSFFFIPVFFPLGTPSSLCLMSSIFLFFTPFPSAACLYPASIFHYSSFFMLPQLLYHFFYISFSSYFSPTSVCTHPSFFHLSLFLHVLL